MFGLFVEAVTPYVFLGVFGVGVCFDGLIFGVLCVLCCVGVCGWDVG